MVGYYSGGHLKNRFNLKTAVALIWPQRTHRKQKLERETLFTIMVSPVLKQTY
jgi:hypothetical protein